MSETISRPIHAPCQIHSGIGLFIYGQWIHDREWRHEIRNPSDENVIGYVPRARNNNLDAYTATKSIPRNAARARLPDTANQPTFSGPDTTWT